MGLLLRAARVLLARRRVRIALGAAMAVGTVVVARSLGPAHPADRSQVDDDCLTLPADGDELPARTILNRVWFDKYPDKPRDDINIALWLRGGIGLYESGSAYRSAYELFEFERSGDRMDLRLLQDKKQASMRFKVSKCDADPFNVCLTIEGAPRGPAKYFGFA